MWPHHEGQNSLCLLPGSVYHSQPGKGCSTRVWVQNPPRLVKLEALWYGFSGFRNQRVGMLLGFWLAQEIRGNVTASERREQWMESALPTKKGLQLWLDYWTRPCFTVVVWRPECVYLINLFFSSGFPGKGGTVVRRTDGIYLPFLKLNWRSSVCEPSFYSCHFSIPVPSVVRYIRLYVCQFVSGTLNNWWGITSIAHDNNSHTHALTHTYAKWVIILFCLYYFYGHKL